MKTKRIAYSLCGEGFGHYGRSIGIIKNLSARFPDYFIDIYCYDYTFDMMSRDRQLPANVTVNKIPGFRFRHNKKSKVVFLRTILFSRKNWITAFKLARLELIRFIAKPIAGLFNKNSNIAYEWTKNLVKDFDLAVVDWEPLLPTICRLRNKKYISIDSIHLLEYAAYRKEGFNLKDWYYLLVNKIVIKVYSPLSNLSIITTIHNFKIRKKYESKIYEVGPLVRKEMSEIVNDVVYEDFVLVYVRKMIRASILPVLKQYKSEKFIVFTEELTDLERDKYSDDHIEFHDVDPKIFVDYLRRCKAVLSTSGYTLISESVVLKKPFFALVLGGILGFEQKLSLYSLQKSGCGDGCNIRNFSADKLDKFSKNMDKFTSVLKTKQFRDDTDKVCDIISDVIKEPELFDGYVSRLISIKK